MREVKLPSGAVLKVNSAPFPDSKALYQAALAELKGVSIDSRSDRGEVFKNLLCAALSSQKVDLALKPCLERCTVNSGAGDLKIDDQTFEPEKMREDYVSVCEEVFRENVYPFLKSLYAGYLRILHAIDATQK